MLRILLTVVLSFFLVAPALTSVTETGDQVSRVEHVLRDGHLYIDADIDMTLSPTLRHMAGRGIPIYFTADLKIETKRWWWFNKVVADQQQTWRVVYNALTRQWRVGTGDLSLPEASLDDALSAVRHIRGWAVADATDLKADELYEGRIRLRLDTSLLARPFQIDALNSSAWSLTTPWKNFNFLVSADELQP